MRFWANSIFVCLAVLLLLLAAPTPAVAQNITVLSTNPSAAEQGTISLDVTINGSGYKRGAKAKWFVTGTTNPGGVTVNRTTFVSSSQLVANITVAFDAVISDFDVQVANSDGRTGVGIDAFTVNVGKCTTTGTPAGFTLVAVLNTVQPNGAALITSGILGNGIRVRPVDLNGDQVPDALVAVVTSGNSTSPGTYAFLLNPNTGVPLANNPVTGAPWQNPMLLLSGLGASHLEVGDVNGDGVPDFLVGNGFSLAAYLFVGRVASNALSYTAYQVAVPANAPLFGAAVALGDLDGDGKDELAIGATGGTGKKTIAGAVYLYKFSTSPVPAIQFVKSISDPAGNASGTFGYSLGIGNVDGDTSYSNDLVVGAPSAYAGNPGIVYVFKGPVLTQTSWFTLNGPGDNFGWGLMVGDVHQDGAADAVITNKGNSAQPAAMVFAGAVGSGSTFSNSLQPVNGLTDGWDWPNMDIGTLGATGAVAVGAPNASNASTGLCHTYLGAVHLFLSPYGAVQPSNYVFEPPTFAGSGFGYGVGIAKGYPFLLIGEHYRDVGTTATAGQVYIYKKN